MFFNNQLSGKDLPPKTVCLTFDDGPGDTIGTGAGPRTLELAVWLHSRGIQANFFVLGKSAVKHREILAQLNGMGHLIGNHTFTHASLGRDNAARAATEILDTDRVIGDFTTNQLAVFRAPYGNWDSTVAGRLNWTAARRYIGPVHWDIDGGDWYFWRNGMDVASCAALYIDLIRQSGRGIILMHDSSFDDDIRRKSRTFELAQQVVGWLQDNDYQFVRLDAIPQVRNAARVSSVVALQASDGHYISPKQGGGGKVHANGASVGVLEPLGVVELGDNKIALQCLSGRYFSAQRGGGGEILANAPVIGAWEVLTRADLGDGAITLRCANGDYLSAQQGGGGQLLANGHTVGAWEALRVVRPAYLPGEQLAGPSVMGNIPAAANVPG